MGTLLGAVFGYLLRGTTGSEGFEQLSGSARAVMSSPQFESLVRAARSHAGYVIKDVTATLARQADHVADAVAGTDPAAAAAPADWEQWPPAPGGARRPFADELHWPEG